MYNKTKFIAELNPFRYRGYYYDTESNLYYLNSRYYDPEIGRFINSDDINVLLESQNFINGLNLYSYCFNNPVNDIDESGNWSWKKFWKGLVTAVVAVVAVAAVTVATGGSAAVVLAGAGIGAATAGISSAITQCSVGDFSWGQFAVDVAFGAITGAFGGSTIGLFGSIVSNGITAGLASMTSDWVNGNNVDIKKASVSYLLGCLYGLMAGPGIQNGFTNQTKQLMNSRNSIKNNIANGHYSSNGGRGALNLNKYYLKIARSEVRQVGMFSLIIGFKSSLTAFYIQTLIDYLKNK